MPASPDGDDTPLRLVYREILPGDRKKFIAQSNTAKSGGGARDIRVRLKAAEVLKTFFPEEITKDRKRKGTKQATAVRKGKLYWHDADADLIASEDFFLESPTDARKGEARIPTVYKYACFRKYKFPPASEGKVFLLFVQKASGQVWPHFVSLQKLDAANDWDLRVVGPIHACAAAKRNKTAAVSGVIDFENPDLNFCNGK